jgi:hypothetical protein
VDNVRVSPDGQLLASVERETEGFSVVVRRGQDRRTLSRGWTFISGLAWTVDGSGLFVTGIGPDDSDDAVLRIGIDGRVRRVLRASPRIRVLDAAAPDRLLIDHAWSTRRSAWVHDPAAAGGRRDLTWLGSSTVDALSNDGRTVLITVRTGPTLERGQSAPLYPIYARPTDGREPILLGNGYGRALSADGRWALTITRPIEAGRHSLVLHPLGPGSPRTLDRGVLDLNGRAQNASFAGPDRIVFDAPDETGSMRTYAQSIDGGTPALVAHEPGQVVSPVAPDGERFVSQRRDGSLWIATLTPHDSTRLPFSLQRGQLIRQWSDDGAYLFVVTPLDDRAMLTKVDVKTGTAVPHADIMRDRLAEALRGFDIRISRDGRTIVFSDTRYLSSLFLVEGAR